MSRKPNEEVKRQEEREEVSSDSSHEETKEVQASGSSQEIAQAELMAEMQEDEGKGTEDIGPRDMALPFLTILQKNHPQCDETNEKRIQNAKPGMFLDTVLENIYPGSPGLEVILCGSRNAIVEWKDRDMGGGLVTQHPADSKIVERASRNASNKLVLGNGNILVETTYHFLLVKDPNTGLYREMVFPMTSTFLKESRRWMTLIKMRTVTINKKTFRPPMFGQKFVLVSILMKKNQYSWFGPNISPMQDLLSDREVYHKAKDLNKAIAKGEILVSAPPIDHSDYSSPETDQSDGENIPF